MLIHGSQDVVSEVIYCLVVDVVFDLEVVGGCGVSAVDGAIPDVLGVLYQ